MTINLKETEKILVEWSPFLVGLALYPAHSTSGVFVLPKYILIIGLLSLIILIRLFRFTEGLGIKTIASVIQQPPIIKLIILIIPTLFVINIYSFNPLVSLFGIQSLQTGIFFWCLCLVTVWALSRGQDYKPSLKPTLYLLVISSVIAILESLGFTPLNFLTEKYIEIHAPYPRVAAGYNGHFAGFMAYLVLVPLVYFKNYRNWVFVAIFSLGIFALGCTTNTSAFLGAAVGILLFVLLYRKMDAAIPLVLFLVLINSYGLVKSANKFLYEKHIVSTSLEARSVRETTTFKTRELLWKASFNLFKARPFVGWGIDNYDNLWYKALSKSDGDKLLRLEFGIKPEQKFSRIDDSFAYKDKKGESVPGLALYYSSHSATFDILYGQGIVGILLYFAFIVTVVVQLWKTRQARMFLVPAIAYLVYLQAWFPTVTNMLVFAILLSFGLSYSYISEKEEV